ncbi:MAG: hypothetical protein RJB26_689 [Pseudomonadota bacterium]
MSLRGFATRATLQSAAGATGNGTVMDVTGIAWVGLQVTGITTATITWECSIDGANWEGIRATQLSTGTAAATATANGIYQIDARGVPLIRARISAFTTGSITVVATAESD